MAKLLPEEKLLPVIMEGEQSSFTFTYEIDSSEEFESILIEADFPDYIDINGPTFSGVFFDLFELPKNSLKFRKGLEFGEVSKFSDLPPKGEAQLYSYTAPSVMRQNFDVKVTLKYHDILTPENSLNITKYYVQPIQGNWNTFRQQFLDYVR